MITKSQGIEDTLFHYFQPIYDIQSLKRIGIEGLLRSETQVNPELMFNNAKKTGQLFELDMHSITTAVDTVFSTKLPRLGKLFLNVYPSTILHPSFQALLKKINSMDLPNNQIVLEISENELIGDFETLKAQLSKIKSLGFLLAVDDFGKGYANFQSIIELEPDFIKLDRYFSIDLKQSKQKQSIIKLLLHYSQLHECQIVLEGVETLEALKLAQHLGIPYAQGYYLGKPAVLQHIHDNLNYPL
ncbi:EAL domain-containing protein [Butyricicoccus sp. 1XD8-22]|nr:EAL domain-containing protein [Butyricicoccus sp. 1XD8-22]